MTIQVNTDSNIIGTETLAAPYVAQIESKLSTFSELIISIEVELSDEDGQTEGPTKQCLMEAKLDLRLPVKVSHQANTLDEAVDGALAQLTESLETIVSKLSNP